ncbi:MAG: hypothetical protein KJ799_09960 [Bacteroidetes bacterium]|nr:hypothetical protein [Bacteroidota bacterium]MBU2507033.1 hypothetical protein [Bacteroidota bacterium]
MLNKTKLLVLVTLFLTLAVINYAGDIKGKVEAKGVKNNANAVVYIEDIPGIKFNPSKENAKMDQKNLTFIPHVLPIVVGTTVEYINSDDVLHNVFSPDKCAEKFNLGTWAKGKSRSYTFNEAKCYSVMLCNVHPEMEAFIVVLKNPYFALTDKKGNYLIKDVPEGKYKLKVWHEKLKEKSLEITVSKDSSITHDFEIKK